MNKVVVKIVLFSLMNFINTNIFAQWIKTNSPNSDVIGITVVDSTVYAIIDSKVYCSADSGISWTEVNAGLIEPVKVIDSDSSNIYAGTVRGAFILSNHDTSWKSISQGLGRDPYVNILTVNASELYAGVNGMFGGSSGGVFLSTDKGMNWSLLKGSTSYPISIDVSGENIFVGRGGKYLPSQHSTDHGKTWKDIIFPKMYVALSACAFNGSNVFAGTNGGLFLSTDNGTSWELLNDRHNFGSLSFSNQYLFAITHINLGRFPFGKIILSSDNGKHWDDISLDLPSVRSIALDNSTIYAGTSNGIWRKSLSLKSSI